MNNPIRYFDPNGKTERAGWQAGTVENKSSVVIHIAADVAGEVKIISLKPGESSTKYVGDADALVIEEEHPLDGNTEGAYKIGTQDVAVEDTEGGLYLDMDNLEIILNWLSGKQGFLSKEEAEANNWVLDPTPEAEPDGSSEEDDSQSSDAEAADSDESLDDEEEK